MIEKRSQRRGALDASGDFSSDTDIHQQAAERPMPRIDCPEFEDQSWFPKPLRNMLTDYLQFIYDKSGVFDPLIPLLKRALAETGAVRLVDLCSGGGGPVPHLQQRLAAEGVTVEATLTDKFPNLTAFRRLCGEHGGRLSFVEHPVDASAVPDSLTGFRTLFTAFHHLPPALAQKVLSDAVNSRQGIGVFEVNERSPVAFFFNLLTPVFVLLSTPFIRPRRWQRFLLTYVPPVVPLVTMWDGIASNLRTYSLKELERMTDAIPTAPGAYTWEMGHIQARHGRRITYLLGLPQAPGGAGGVP